ncbi:DUF6262 family protein [Virgibacillus salexigens]|uniref:DUF6262 family protein n=1 Tax=Virgibacillus salexigens TaxID=61016 RepID=UPI00190DF470|nr:DUF6262 family protein [Virgibacillus salexigens]
MASYDRREHLKAIHASRKALTYQKVDDAITRLIRFNESINFNSVAIEAGVAKATLYNNSELRERIESLRQRQIEDPTSKQINRNINEGNKDALIQSLKRKVKKLEEENKQLKEQVKLAYGEVYKKF